MSGLQELGSEEGGSELIAHIRVIQVLPVADNWIDEDEVGGTEDVIGQVGRGRRRHCTCERDRGRHWTGWRDIISH